jgi:hypothetical protein
MQRGAAPPECRCVRVSVSVERGWRGICIAVKCEAENEEHGEAGLRTAWQGVTFIWGIKVVSDECTSVSSLTKCSLD